MKHVRYGFGNLLRIVTGSLFLLAVFTSTSGCSSPNTNRLSLEALQIRSAADPNVVYRIGRGDMLEIKFRHNEELNEEVTVRPDGRISMQVAHDVDVVGKTPAKLSALLTKICSSELSNPEITVIVRSFSAQRAYVNGEVFRPCMVPLNGSVTVLQAVAEAGGFKETARLNEVVLIRRTADGSPVAASLDLLSVIRGNDLRQDVELQPYDVIYVPRTPIANLNLWVDQYLRKIMPLPLNFSFGYRLDDKSDR